MKQSLIAVIFLSGCLFNPVVALAQPGPREQLLQMEQASHSLNYELAFIYVSHMGIESLRYRHAVIDHKVYAQLLQMDGPRREIVQRGEDISYFEPGLEPFTLNARQIVDFIPSVLYADFNQLNSSYDFVSVGRTRIANQICDVIRIVARDGTRYSYIIWRDVKTKLPLRVDMLDNDGETLEQYRVISFVINKGAGDLMKQLINAAMPPSLSVPTNEKHSFRWKPNWLPQGMREITQSRRDVPSLNKLVESRLYSDGLFSFSINVSHSDKNSLPQLLRNGRRTVQTEVRDNMEITVVGELPPATAKRIAASVMLSPSP